MSLQRLRNAADPPQFVDRFLRDGGPFSIIKRKPGCPLLGIPVVSSRLIRGRQRRRRRADRDGRLPFRFSSQYANAISTKSPKQVRPASLKRPISRSRPRGEMEGGCRLAAIKFRLRPTGRKRGNWDDSAER